MANCSFPIFGGQPVVDQMARFGETKFDNQAVQAEINATENTSGIMTLAQAAKTLPHINGRRIHSSTLWRWCRRGCKGVHLQYFRVGRSIMVTEDGLHHFFLELTKLDSKDSEHSDFKSIRRKKRSRSDLERQRAQQDSEAILRRAKILV